MDFDIIKLLIKETRKSLEKLCVAEKAVHSNSDDGGFIDSLTYDASYQEAAQEIRLFISQIEKLTDTRFTHMPTAFISAEATVNSVEPNLKAVEQLIQVLSSYRKDTQE
ncbi:MAG: hypothetical protein J5915_10680 [Acidaminococcaceae bacterium]|nr:hypothetical protein [Acidaminococcaceae bacterium]MBQ5345033.1 hypothetical protein [Acidaminococcaceae bacterium]